MLKKMWGEIHQSWLVVAWCIGIIFGAILTLILRINYFASPIWILVVGLLMVGAFLKPKLIFLTIALVAGMILMFFRCTTELSGEDYIRQFYGQTVQIVGVVDGDPEFDDDEVKFKLKDLRFGEERKVSGSIYVTARDEDLARSDEVTLMGKLENGFGTFAGYMYKPKIVKIVRPEPGDLVLTVRNWFAARIKNLIPETEASLGLSYLLGMKSGLSDALTENLRAVGLVHIVVASGAHLAILVEIARKIFGKISRFAGLLFSILFILFFMAMVGWTPSIMRAGIMAIITLGTWYVGRKIEPWRIILIVAAITLMINPNFIVNLGWLLSLASYAGIMILAPRLKKIFYGAKKPGFIAEMITMTVSATLMTLPIILYFYGQISLISVVANLLILPTLPYAMGLVFLTGVFAGLPFMETVTTFFATKLLDFHIMIVNFLGEREELLIKIEPYQNWVWLGYGLILLFLAVDFTFRVKNVRLKIR